MVSGGRHAGRQIYPAERAFKAAQPWNPQTAQVFGFVKDFWNMPEYCTMLRC